MRVFDIFQEYCRSQGKKKSSYLRGISWNQITENEAFEGAHAVATVLELILKEGIWSDKVPNKETFLPALRNRPMDKVYGGVGIWRDLMVSSGYTIGDMWRSRGALGIIPLSHVWAYAYNVKDDVVASFMDRLTANQTIFNPITSPDFYKDYASKTRNGWYIFGDNMAYLKDGEEYICDVAMSEVLQAYLRQGPKGENLCWFPYLDGHIRQAPSGDPFTTMWNMEGDLGLIQVWDEDPGLFESDNIGLPDIIEESDAFLGMARTGDKLVNMGIKLTVDNTDQRIPVYLKPKGGALSWAPPKVDLSRAIQTIISYGLHPDIDLVWWYDHVGVTGDTLSLDYLSADERIRYGIETSPGILDEVLEIIGERSVTDWWPHLAIDMMRRKIDERTDRNETEGTGMEGSAGSD
jgi:hypothetical protein